MRYRCGYMKGDEKENGDVVNGCYKVEIEKSGYVGRFVIDVISEINGGVVDWRIPACLFLIALVGLTKG